MCTPALIMGTTALSGIVSAAGVKAQSEATANLYKYQQQAAITQEGIVSQTAEANITAVQDQAARQATLLGRQQATLKGAQTAAEGAQGIGGSVTAADIAKDTLSKQQLDQMTLQYNANVKTWDITNQKNNQIWGLSAQATQSGLAAKNVVAAGNIQAIGSLLNTASQVGTEAYYINK